MLISRFNRLIHNKLIWICFAVLVCIAFVFSGAGLTSGIGDAQSKKQTQAGTMNGEPVDIQVYRTALVFEQGPMGRSPKTPAEKVQLQQDTWKRIAAKKPIEAMGLSVTDQELLEVIQQEFSQNGVFSKEMYRAILYEKLQWGQEFFEAYLRDVILFQKTAGVFESCVWTPPAEIEKRLTDLSDEFILHYVILDPENMVPEPELTESDLKDFYEEHREALEISEERKVRYVSFPITNHLTDVVVKEEDIQRYYQANAKKYENASTNGMLLTPEIKKDIELTLQYEGATSKARKDAMSMAMALVKDRSVAPSSEAFLAQAALMGLSIQTSAYFVVDEPVPGIAATREFNAVAFQLSPDRPISDAIAGANAVYILDLNDIRGPRIPDFEEIEEKIRMLASYTTRSEEFRDKAREFETAVSKGLASGQSFKDIADLYSLSISTTTAFSVYSPNVSSNQMPIIEELSQVIVGMKAGDATPLVPIKQGATLAYISSRTPADPLSLQVLRPQLIQSLNRYRSAAVMEDWKNHLLARAELVDTFNKPDPAADPTNSDKPVTATPDAVEKN